MSFLAGLFTNPLIGFGLQAFGAISNYQSATSASAAQQQAYQYQAAVARNNQQIAEWQAQSALQAGAYQVQRQQLNTAQLMGTQRASLAARGIAIDQGSALNILLDTDFMGRLDAQTIKSNAEKEAWGYRVQAQNAAGNAGMYSARAGASRPAYAGLTSLLTDAPRVASSWLSYSQSINGANG